VEWKLIQDRVWHANEDVKRDLFEYPDILYNRLPTLGPRLRNAGGLESAVRLRGEGSVHRVSLTGFPTWKAELVGPEGEQRAAPITRRSALVAQRSFCSVDAVRGPLILPSPSVQRRSASSAEEASSHQSHPRQAMPAR
jgi:hypothetical protein